MAFQPLSVGDILLLSQQAWKIGRAFRQGNNNALSEFTEVEREADGLSDALKLTAEVLHADDSILSRADSETQDAVNAILLSAQKTLGDLESFVDRYQVIRKRKTNGGFVVEKSWSEALMANYRTFMWTTEGGNIRDLRNLLQMHSDTINLTIQALQSRSLARLEKTVIPMAENINSIHESLNGDLGDKIDDLHRIIMAIAQSTPSLMARNRPIEEHAERMRRASGGTSSMMDHVIDLTPHMLGESYSRASTPTAIQHPDRGPHDSVQSQQYSNFSKTPQRAHRRYSSRDQEFDDNVHRQPQNNAGAGLDGSPASLNGKSFLAISPLSSPRRIPNVPRRESSTLPNMSRMISEDSMDGDSILHGHLDQDQQGRLERESSAVTRPEVESRRWFADQLVLPPPSMRRNTVGQYVPATPSSLLVNRSLSNDSGIPYANIQSAAEMTAFRAALLRNALILCDVRGELIEYTRHKPDEPDPRYNTDLIEVCKQARICVVRKKENLAHGGEKAVTSIWTLNEDATVRCQQKLSEDADTIPYCSYFQPEKVSLAEQAMVLRFHGRSWGDKVEKEIKTNWLNYVFASESDAYSFQSAVFGHTLIATFPTKKTVVIHPGVMGAFALEEQFANIETLRLWKDNGVLDPDSEGGVFALMHLSSNFGEGWARWWMNSSRQQVRVTSDGSRHAKIKGVDIAIVKPGTSPPAAEQLRRASTGSNGTPIRRVTGVKVEFKTETERDRFIQMSRLVQEDMLLLPNL